MRIKKGLVEMRVTKREREGPRARSAYPIPAATVIIIPLSLSLAMAFFLQNQLELLRLVFVFAELFKPCVWDGRFQMKKIKFVQIILGDFIFIPSIVRFTLNFH